MRSIDPFASGHLVVCTDKKESYERPAIGTEEGSCEKRIRECVVPEGCLTRSSSRPAGQESDVTREPSNKEIPPVVAYGESDLVWNGISAETISSYQKSEAMSLPVFLEKHTSA